MIVKTVERIIEKYLSLSGLTKRVTPRTFRHSCASHLLGRGAEAGNVRIMDFGIARSLESKSITGAGVMIGTREYMSPEQVEGKEVEPATYGD